MYGFYWSVEFEKLYKTSSSQCSKLAAMAAESYTLFDSASNLFNNARASQSWIDLCENAKLLCELRRLSNYSRMFMKENKRFSNPYGKGLCLAEYVLRKIDSLPPSLQNQMGVYLKEIKEKMNAVKKIITVNQLEAYLVSKEEIILIDEPVKEPSDFYEPEVYMNQTFCAFIPQSVGVLSIFEVGHGEHAEVCRNSRDRDERRLESRESGGYFRGSSPESRFQSKRGLGELV